MLKNKSLKMIRKRVFKLLILTLVIYPTAHTFAQKESKLLKNARKAMYSGDYVTAKEIYGTLLEKQPDNNEYLFEAGLAYYYSPLEKEKAIEYFEKSLQHSRKDTLGEAYYYLGRVLHYTGDFERAIVNYNLFKQFVRGNSEGLVLKKDVDRYIEMCNNGKRFYSNKDDSIIIENMGEQINTIYPEYAALINKNKDVLISTSRRNGTTGAKVHHDNKLYEDIYVSVFDGTGWSLASKIDSTNDFFSGKINSKLHDAAICYSHDESKFYLYRKNMIWVSELKNGMYQDPVPLEKTINSGDHQPSVFISADEKTMIVTSTQETGGFGGRDLWKSVLQEDGSWSKLENLGPEINTAFDEDAPFLTRDGKTLFFSSSGHNTMGGYDIFKSTIRKDGTWGRPENLGVPINTPADDIFYIQDEASESAFFSSSRTGGYGDMDIYSAALRCRNIPNTEIRGVILAAEDYSPVKAHFTVYNTKTGEQVGTFESDAKSGKYLAVLPPENTYRLEFTADGFEADRSHFQEFTIPRQCEYFQLYQEVFMTKLKNDKQQLIAQEAKFNNAMFDIKKEATELYGITEMGKTKSSSANTQTLAGKIMHTDEIMASEVTIMLINGTNEIVRSQTTALNGSYKFTDLDTNQTYRLAVVEEDLKKSFYGKNTTQWNNDIVANGQVVKNLIDAEGFAGKERRVADQEILMVGKNMKIVSTARTDANGQFKLDNVNRFTGESPTFTYKLDEVEEEVVFALFVRNLDENSDLPYTQVIDRIDFDVPPAEKVAFSNIYFDFDRYFIRDKDKDIMKKVANYMKENTESKIVIMGHADWIGSDEYNMNLSKKRALSAQAYLADNTISQNRIKLEWYGESRPAVPNADPNGKDLPENRQLNRRCEFKIQVSETAYISISY